LRQFIPQISGPGLFSGHNVTSPVTNIVDFIDEFGWHGFCLNRYVIKITHLKQRLQPSAVGKILCPFIALLALAAITLHAGEPPVVLATSKNYSAPTAATSAPTSNLEKKPAMVLATAKVGKESESEFLTRTRLERQMRNESRNRKFDFKIGYGEIWHGQSEIEKIPADRQPTSFAYFMARFRF
jgi:hypothetical protein